MSNTNLTLLTDLYQLTMMQGYFKANNKNVAVFDAFYRKNPCDGGYAIFAGLQQVIEYIENLPTTNAIKFILEDGSSIAIRPSGTEPKCKFYYGSVSKSSYKDAEEKVEILHDAIVKMLNIEI